jgi:hypothetical protein
MTGALKSVANSAVAADGGSLLLVLEWGDGRVETLFLNRSIASQGTAAYDTVTSDKRLLSATNVSQSPRSLSNKTSLSQSKFGH